VSKRIIIEKDVDIPMRDGTVLKADAYRPDTDRELPVLLQRTPYGKDFSQIQFALMGAERGYGVVIQDTRGRWSSQGDSYPFIHEKDDGYDTVEWAASQPWADGQVGMFGASYVGYTQWAAAAMRPPALKTIIPAVSFCQPYDFVYTGGSFSLGASVSWGLMAGALMEIQRFTGSESERELLLGQFIRLADGMARGETYHRLPLEEMPLIGRQGISPYFADLLQHPEYDEYWSRVTCHYEDIDIPIFHVGSWYDLFIDSTIKDYLGIQSQASEGDANRQQKLVIGPWTHGSFESTVGEVDFGVLSSWMFVLPEEQQLDWFDYWLKGDRNGIPEEAPIRIFVLGENRWRDEYEWPLARTEYIPYYLHSGGSANSRHGDGALNRSKPEQEPLDTFVYDPRNPVPTRGGGLCCHQGSLPPGAYDQRQVESRPDVLVYTTTVLEDDLEVTGPVQLRLWASSSAVETDFTAKLVDVEPDGYARNLQDSIVNTSYALSSDKPTLMQSGGVYQITLELGPTSNVFKAGHRIRLEVSSSNFPRFARNPNTGSRLAGENHLRPATQAVFHDTGRPSHLILPVIPG
jgi:putative CocE/NonD family hydrolase